MRRSREVQEEGVDRVLAQDGVGGCRERWRSAAGAAVFVGLVGAGGGLETVEGAVCRPRSDEGKERWAREGRGEEMDRVLAQDGVLAGY